MTIGAAPQVHHGRPIAEIVDQLAALARPPGSQRARLAAEMIADELAARGARVRREEEHVHGTYWTPIGIASAVGAASGRCGRLLGTAGASLSAVGIADDLEIGRRPLRRLLGQRLAVNVIGEFGPSRAAHTLVVHAHHDAARTGLVFHPGVAKLAARHAGQPIERGGGTPAPMWGAVAGPAAVALGCLLLHQPTSDLLRPSACQPNADTAPSRTRERLKPAAMAGGAANSEAVVRGAGMRSRFRRRSTSMDDPAKPSAASWR